MNLLPKEFLPLILAFAPLFSKPVWESAIVLLVGAIVAPGKRTVSAILQVMGMQHDPHFQNYHRVLSRAVWSSRQASRLLLQQLVRVFVPSGVLVMGIDDTIERRWGKRIAARGIYRDPVRSSDSHFVKTSGLRWLSLMLLINIPWVQRVWALPFFTVLAPSERYHQIHGHHHKTLTDWARQMLTQVRRWLPQRAIVLVADSSFAALELLEEKGDNFPEQFMLSHDYAWMLPSMNLPRSVNPSKWVAPALVGNRLPTLKSRLDQPQTCWQSLTIDARQRRTLLSAPSDIPDCRVVSHWLACGAHPLGAS